MFTPDRAGSLHPRRAGQRVLGIRALPYRKLVPTNANIIVHQAWKYSPDGSMASRSRRPLRESAAGARRRRPAPQRGRESHRQCAEALENSAFREILVSTMPIPMRNGVICVSDTGTGIRRKTRTNSSCRISRPRTAERDSPRHRRSDRGGTRRQYPRRGQSSGRIALPR